MPYTYDYPMFSYCVDAVLFAKYNSDHLVLLIQRKNDPFKDYWAFPGGFVDQQEVADQAVYRELKEETGIAIDGLARLDVFDKVGRDPRGRTVSVVYTKVLDAPVAATGLDDAADARWFNIKELPALAFDHSEIMNRALVFNGLQ